MNFETMMREMVRQEVLQAIATLPITPQNDGWMTRAEVARFWQCSWETAASRLAQPGAPHFFDADGKRKPPDLTPLQACRAALDALRQAAKEAAEHLRHEAAELKRAHTISGEWDGAELEAMAECKRLIALADRLQANAELCGVRSTSERAPG